MSFNREETVTEMKLRVPRYLKERVSAHAQRALRSLNAEVIIAIFEHLERLDKIQSQQKWP